MSAERQQISAERVARNDARFREANEQLQEAAESLGFEPDARTPYLCECADLGCTMVLQLTASEYERVRRNPVRFINAHGHERTAQGWARVVEEYEHYSVVEKVGEAAEIAAELDPRQRVADERA
jgi:hypothetical protein